MSQVKTSQPKVHHYFFVWLMISLALLGLNQLIQNFNTSDGQLLLFYNSWLCICIYVYACFIIDNKQLGWRYPILLIVIIPLVSVGAVLGGTQVLFVSTIDTGIKLQILGLVCIQYAWLLFRYLVGKVQSNYQSRLKLAGIDANLDNALFRIRAGYVGQQFIAQTLAKVAQDATKNNAQAIGMVEDLGLLMRFALETSQKPSIKFSDEMYALDIFCRLYNQLMFEKQNQLKLRCHTQAENQVLPMAIYGLMAYVLSKFASEVKSIANWHINIDINCDSNFLCCSVLCQPCAIESEDEKQRLCMLLNDQVIDTMRFRLEQEYSHGSYIECEESQDITFRISIPCVASTQK